jgi:transposase
MTSRWSKTGVWEKVFQHLAADADNEYAMIDATIVRAYQHSAGAKKADALRSGLLTMEAHQAGGSQTTRQSVEVKEV